MLFLIPIAIIFTTLCKGIATYFHSFQMSKIAHNIISTLQSEMYKKLMYFNLDFFNEAKSANLISLEETLQCFNVLGKFFTVHLQY